MVIWLGVDNISNIMEVFAGASLITSKIKTNEITTKFFTTSPSHLIESVCMANSSLVSTCCLSHLMQGHQLHDPHFPQIIVSFRWFLSSSLDIWIFPSERLEPANVWTLINPVFLTCCLHPPPDDQIDLAVPGRPVHQINDVSVRLPHHWDPVHKQQLVAGPQASVQVCRALLDDRADQDLLSKRVC